MALQKSIADPYSTAGLPSAYFRIIETNFDYDRGSLRVVLGIYSDKASRDDGLPPVGTLSFSVSDSPGNGPAGTASLPTFTQFVLKDNVAAFDAARTATYNLAKTLPELTGAIDIL